MLSPNYRRNSGWLKSEIGVPLREMSDGILGPWGNLHASPPNHIHHYTTVHGLLGIASSSSLWATDLRFFSDASELQYGYRLVRERLQEKYEAATSDATKILFDRAQSALAPEGSYYSYYGVCFCETSDLLSQWRAYAGRGGGYAIGFRSLMLLTTTLPSPDLRLRKVIYDHITQRSLIDDVCDRAKVIVESSCKTRAAESVIPHVLSCMRDHLEEFYFCFKDPLFKEEAEWRLIAELTQEERVSAAALRFRPGHGVPIPYLEIKPLASAGPWTGRLPISSVVHGPTLDPRSTQLALEMLLRKHAYPFVEVAGSKIPLRG